MTGVLGLVGGNEWQSGCDFDAELLAASGGNDVLVLPTAAAYEHPERAVATATEWFAPLGGSVRGLMVLRHAEANDEANAAAVRAAPFVYLSGGSPLHLRSVLKDSAVWAALREAWQEGAVVAASSAGAMALCDPMVDPRGGAYTLGLGLVAQLAVIPHANTWSHEKARRTFELARAGTAVLGIDESTAAIRDRNGTWHASGAGHVAVWKDGKEAGLDILT